jgi:arylsulfatase A-like enzyme
MGTSCLARARLIAGLVTLATTVTPFAAAAPAGPPNVVLIYADDVGYGDVSANGASAIRTPNVDRLAAEGMRFTSAHAAAATCTPSRYALLTGEYAWRKPGTNVLPGDAGLVIQPGRATLPAMMRAAGYATGVVGKWHLGLGSGGVDWNRDISPGPLDIGFDYAFLIPATGDRVPTVFVENRRVVALDPSDPIRVSYREPIGSEPTGQDRPDLLKVRPSHGHDQTIVNGISRIGYMSGGRAARWVDEDIADTITAKAVSFIERHRERPFFLYFATHDIHVPRVPHPRFAGKSGMGPRGDAILEFDWSVGQILGALDRLKLADDTLVIVTSDNGPVVDDGYEDQAVERLGAHRPSGPLRGGKYSAFLAGTRVPFLLRWPAKVTPGVSHALVGQVDLFSSFASLVGQTPKPGDAPDSKNVLPALLGTSSTGREWLAAQAGALSVIRGKWKYIEPREGPRVERNTNVELGNDALPQLFDLETDPSETRNLASEHPREVDALALLLKRVRDGMLGPSASAPVTTRDMASAIDVPALQHPYLFFSEADKPALRARVQDDPEARAIMERLRTEADRLLGVTVDTAIPNEQKHPRFWTDGVHDRMVGEARRAARTLAFVYQMTGDAKYAQKALAFADALCDLRLWLMRAHEFPIIYSRVWPWGVKDDQVSFNYDIRSGDIALELGIVYDWLYPALSKAQRDRLRGALLGNAILLVRNNYDYHWWATAYRCNWLGIGFSGFGIASLALLTEQPELIDGIAETHARLVRMFDELDVDGGWQEGRGYWAYGMRSCVYFMDALKRLTRGKYDLFQHPRIRSAPAAFALYGLTANFGDGTGAAVGSTHLLNKLVAETRDTDAAFYRASLLPAGADMFDIVWPRGTVEPVEPAVRSRHFRGIDWAVMRSAFNDPETMTVATKAGANDDPHHGHLDVGQVVVTWRGQAFIADHGWGKYFYDEKYFDEARWTYPVAGSEGHNLVFVDGETQLSAKYKDKPWAPGIAGRILEFRTSPGRDYTLMDNEGAYARTHLKGWRRHVVLDKPVTTVLLDEIASAAGAEIEARFHSEAVIQARDRFALLEGARGTLAVIPVSREPFVMRAGSHSYRPVKKDAEPVVIPYVGSVVRAATGTTRLATLIVPVADEAEALAIARSVKVAAGADRWSFSFTRAGQTQSYRFVGADRLVLERQSARPRAGRSASDRQPAGADDDRDDRERGAHPEVVREGHPDAFRGRPLDRDDVGHRASQGEVASQRGGHRQRQPARFGVGKPRDDRSKQHHGRHVAHDVAQQGGRGHEHGKAVEVEHLDGVQQRCRQPRPVRPADDDEEPDEEDQQPPVDLVVDRRGLDGPRDQQHGGANGGHEGRRDPGEEARQYEDQHDGGFHPRGHRSRRRGHDGILHADAVDGPAQAEPVHQGPVGQQAHDGDRPQARDEGHVRHAGQRPDEHVLRVAGDRRHAADVRRRRHRDHVGHDRDVQAPRHLDHDWRHDQADHVVDEKGGQDPAREHDGRQQVVWVQARDEPAGDGVEEAGQPEVAGDHHHREQQDDRGEVDRGEGLACADDAEGDHEHGADDRCARAIDLHAREGAKREHQIAAGEDQVRRDGARL